MAKTPKMCSITPSFNLDVKAEGDNIKITGLACIQKSLLKKVLEKYDMDGPIIEEVMKAFENIPGKTIFLDLNMMLRVGSE